MVCAVQNKKGIKADAIDLTEFVDFVKLNKLQTDCFVIGQKTNVSYSCLLYICEWNSIVGLEFWIELFISG